MSTDKAWEHLANLHHYLHKEGLDRADFGIEPFTLLPWFEESGEYALLGE